MTLSNELLEAYPRESICAMFERQVDRTPTAIALLCEGRVLTYEELESRVNALAWHLRERHGVGRESRVGLLLDRTERMLISMLAVMKAGGAYVPITPDYPPNRIAYILDDVKPAVLITEDTQTAMASRISGAQLCCENVCGALREGRTDRLSERPNVSDLAYIMYTSGSTGNPKGVMAEHGNLSNFIQWCHEEYRNSTFDVVYAGTPYTFDLSNIELFFPLTFGRKMRLLPSMQVMGLYLLRDRNVLINTVPSLVLEALKTDRILENVSVLNLGGEPVPPSLQRALCQYAGMEIRNMYGPTETTSTAINYRMDGQNDEILIGKPIAHTYVYVVTDDMRLADTGCKGKIYIGGRGVARGYWNRPELTAQRFLEDPFGGVGRIYRTGDIGICLPDGKFRYLGRNDNQVKLRGYRIELDEVSIHLARHPSVKGAVVGVKNCGLRSRLVAIVSASSDGANAEVLEDFLREQLPPYMVPEEFAFVDALPLTATGKIDRLALFPKD